MNNQQMYKRDLPTENISPELLELLKAEYKLVIDKKSNESASQRAKVIKMYTYLKNRGDIK